MRNKGLTIILAIFVVACNRSVDSVPAVVEPDGSAITVAPGSLSDAVEHAAPVNAVFWSDDASGSFILAAAGIAGLEIYSVSGARKAAVATLEAGLVMLVPDFALGGERQQLVIAYDAATSTTGAYVFDPRSLALQSVMPAPIALRDELTGLCGYRSRLSGSDYLYATTDGGAIFHYELFETDGNVVAKLLRSIPSGKGSSFCAVDPRDGMLYVSEESTGIWRFGAEPESDTTRELVDVRAPWGTLGDDLKGVAIYPVDAELSYLLVADASGGRIVVYALPDGERQASFVVEGVGEPEGLAVTALPLDASHAGGMLAIADESANGGGPNLKLLDWNTLAAAAGLRSATTQTDPAQVAVVRPRVETDVMPSFGDAADDPAIWLHPADPSLSLVIGTNKQAGLHVFDLDGRTLQVLPDGKMNNVDLRYDFPLGGEAVTLVTASNRSNDSIAVYRIDAALRRLVDVAAGVLATGFHDPYGLCMYRSRKSGDFYVFINESNQGMFRQWRLSDDGSGKVSVEQVREFVVGTQAEGCVADDDSGYLYVAEEDVGLWKYSAEPDGGDARTQIDNTEDGRLTDDVEGLALWEGPDGTGYLVVSNQGADNYALYRRDGDNAYVGRFHIVANAAAGIDGASETDGLDVSSAAFGPAYPDGLMVVQDGRNIAPEEPQNFKFVSWTDVKQALQLD
ncbi:MAG TPA: phytase [Woeseiaceae bacterium]|nr:phytase [Woeseiaceae bacterium]